MLPSTARCTATRLLRRTALLSARAAASTDARVGWIGTGVMGSSMAGHLLAAGWDVTVYNRTASKAEPLRAAGAKLASSVAELAAESDVVFSIVGYPADVQRVLLAQDGALAHMKSGGVLVDMTTSEPSLAVRIASEAAARGCEALDAPVSGGDIGARNGTLSVMVGGEEATLARVRPMFDVMASAVTHCGAAGAGQHTKMVNQILIATNMIGCVEGLLYAHRAGLDPLTVIDAVGGGAAGSWSINNLGPRMAARDFEPGFFVDHFVKDMAIALAEAERMQLSLPGLSLAKQLYTAVQAQGLGRKGTQALLCALEVVNGDAQAMDAAVQRVRGQDNAEQS
eukprot:PLAT15390.1.p1 GENE.PLAT15390.1~~PLAT15390.1.p1  ORF type:complete len:340 (-),score=157.77 PLAT15390.1:58-1077(-)